MILYFVLGVVEKVYNKINKYTEPFASKALTIILHVILSVLYFSGPTIGTNNLMVLDLQDHSNLNSYWSSQ